jgi:pimeloyl-ACP methyl ester carboxylesterase
MTEVKTETIHGRLVSYVEAGTGPTLLLIHGMGGSSENWRQVIEPLARNHTVIVPNLPGHGGSEPGPGDYSVGGLAAGLRDLLLLLGHRRATLVGHSLGGGIAMQFAYQFPEIVERLVLVSSGGLGPAVSGLLRAAALPGAGPFIATTAPAARWLAAALGRVETFGLRPGTDVAEVTHGYSLLADPLRRNAFLTTVRSVIGVGGQRVSAVDRLYLAEAVPVLIVWGARDRLVPAHHGESAHRSIPGSRLEIFEGVGHLPQLEAAPRFVSVLERFLAETEPSDYDLDEWLLRFRRGQNQDSGPLDEQGP